MSLSSINGNPSFPAAIPAAPVPGPSSKTTPALQSGSGGTAIEPKSQRPDKIDVEGALRTLNDFTAMVAQDVRFSMDEESGKTIVKVIDTQTKEVLRQFPSAEALSIARSIDKIQGLLIREKA